MAEDIVQTTAESKPLKSRRQFLEASAAVLGGAIAASVGTDALAEAAQKGGENLPPNIPEWMKMPGADTGSEIYGTPSKFEKSVIRNVPKNLKQYTSTATRTPLQDLDGIITPNGLFYERHHGGIPEIDPAQHRLMIHGLADKPLLLTMDDIRRFPSQSRIHFLECSGNPGYKAIYGKTASDLVGLVSCSEWTGVSMKTVLQEAGLKPSAKWIVAEGADSAAMTRSLPIEKCLDDAMLVYSQNGERLRPAQGYPLRVFLPGFEGNMSVKWLRRLHVASEPVYSREETSKYTDLLADGKARQFSFYMEAKSIITKALTRFRLPWTWNGEHTVIMSRATDETGYTQPAFADLAKVRGLNSFYHNNAIIPWEIAASGEVSNANKKA